MLRNILTKFQFNPLSGFWGIVVKRFEFNWRSCFGADTQKLSILGTIRYGKEHTHKISVQSVQTDLLTDRY